MATKGGHFISNIKTNNTYNNVEFETLTDKGNNTNNDVNDTNIIINDTQNDTIMAQEWQKNQFDIKHVTSGNIHINDIQTKGNNNFEGHIDNQKNIHDINPGNLMSVEIPGNSVKKSMSNDNNKYTRIYQIILFVLVLYSCILSTYNFINKIEYCQCSNEDVNPTGILTTSQTGLLLKCYKIAKYLTYMYI